MSIDRQQARKEVFARIDAVWQDKAEPIVGYLPEMRYQGVPEGSRPDKDKYWARSALQEVRTINSAHIMSNEPGESPAEFTSYGLVIIQVFAPKEMGAWEIGEQLAGILQRCFMAANTNSGVWFRNPRINELDQDRDDWFRWNVIVEYQFDQVKGT